MSGRFLFNATAALLEQYGFTAGGRSASKHGS
jgi:hypothetical protein